MDHPLAFSTIAEIIEWLQSHYVDPNERDTARQEYRDLAILTSKTFNQFYSRFSILATRARIDARESLSDLFHKLTLELYSSVLPYMASHILEAGKGVRIDPKKVKAILE